jgi:hypothetical protein
MEHVIAVSNRMLELKLAAFPYFKNYVNAVSAAVADPDTTLFDRWHPAAEKVLAQAENGKTKPVGQFLEFSADFMEHRAFKTGEGGSPTWRIVGGKFDFQFVDTSRQAVVVCRDVNLIGSRKQDSVIVYRAAGRYLPMLGRHCRQSGLARRRPRQHGVRHPFKVHY